jgi:hypothetical protein
MDKAKIGEYLVAAEEHIKRAGGVITMLEGRMRTQPPGGRERQITEETLKTVRDLKATMEQHRQNLRVDLRRRLREERFETGFD